MNLKIIFFLFFLCAKGLLVFGHQGMWIPSLLKVIEGEMQSNGLELSAEDIYSINHSSLKDARMDFGQCQKVKNLQTLALQLLLL
jgi:hypothetical protein